MQASGRDSPSPALQLWEAYHSSSALAGTLRGAVRAHHECAHLAQLLETVSELLCFVFSRFNDALFLGSLNTHVASAAQLLHFGLLKVCRVADSCCSNVTRLDSTAPFSPATTTSSAASAAADIQLAVTVLATAVQYLETTHSVKQSDAAAPQVLPGPRASLQLQQQALLQSSRVAAAAHASARRSTGGARQLSGQLDAVQLCSSTADADTAGLAGNRYSGRGNSSSSTYTQHQQQQSKLDDATQPAVAGEITFNAQRPLEAPADSTAPQQREDEQQQEPFLQQEGQHATSPAVPSAAAATAAEAIDQEAYQAVKLQALQELLLPGSTWSLEESGTGFVYKPNRSRSPQHQHQQLPNGPSAKSLGLLAAPQTGQLHAATTAKQSREQQGAVGSVPSAEGEATAEAATVAEDADAADSIPSAHLAAAECQEAPDTQLAGTLYDEQDTSATGIELQPEPCTAKAHTGCADEAEQQPQQADSLQEEGLQEADAPVSSTAWLQQQLQQIYSNALLQGRKPQQQRHSMLRRSQELMCGVVDAAELPLLPARAQSPEPAGFGLGFVAAGFTSGSGSGGRSGRASTEDLVEAVLGRRARTTGGSSVYSSSMAAAAAAGVVSVLYEPAGRAAGAGRAAPSPNRGRRSPFNSAPGSTRVSVDVTAAGYDSRGGSGSGVSPGMIGTCSPRGYAGRSYASRAASVSGSVRGSGAGASQRRSTSSSPGSAARAASYSGSGRVTPARPASSTGGAAAASVNSKVAAPGSGPGSGCVTPVRSGRASTSGCAAAAQGTAAAGQHGSSSGSATGSRGKSSTSRRASSSPGQCSVKVNKEWQGAIAAVVTSTAGGAASSSRSPSRSGSPSPARQSQSGMRVRDSILNSSRSSSTPGVGSSSGDGAGSNVYQEAVAAAASAAGTVYKSANSSGSGSISGGCGLTRRSSAGSTTLFMSARSSRAGSTAGSVASCHEGAIGRMRTSSTGGAETCSMTSAAGVAVLGMLAAAAGAAGEAVLSGSGRIKISSQGESWLESPAAMQQQQPGGASGMSVRSSRAGSTIGSCSGTAGQLHLAAEDDGMWPGISTSPAVAAAQAEAGVNGALVTGMGCLTLGSCSGARTGRASLASGGASAAIAESVRQSRCSLAGAAAGGSSRQLSGKLAVQRQQQEAAAGSRSGSSAGGRTSGRVSACSMTGQTDVSNTTGAKGMQQEQQQQQQHQEVLDSRAAARQDTKQERTSAAAASVASVSSAVDALAATHTRPVRAAEQQQQQRSCSQQRGGVRQACSSASADDANNEAGVDAWQQPQGQWQQQWQQQQQMWQHQGEQQPDESAADTETQQQGDEDFLLCPRPVRAAVAVHKTTDEQQQQQQGLDDEGMEAQVQGITSSEQCATADSDDFGDFQGSPPADSAVGCSGDSTAAAATYNPGDASGDSAAGEHANRSSLMVQSPAAQMQLAPGAAAADPAAAATAASTAGACPAAPAPTPEAAAEALLADGNAAYTAGKYSAAVQCYAKALDSLGGSIDHTTGDAGVLLWIKCSLNLACCHLRLGQFKQCVAVCDSLLEVDPANIVALCHRGRALLMVQQHAAAKEDLTAALELLEEEAAEQMQQLQSCIGQQQASTIATGSRDAAGVDGVPGREAAAGSDAMLGPLQAADGRAAGGAVRASSRCLSPCTLARMRLNNGYWQQRVLGLLAG